MLTLALLIAVQASAEAPRPGPIRTFGDWVVACDNVKACEMTSLWPGEGQPEEGSPYDRLAASARRAAGPTGGWTVEFQLSDDRKDALRVTTEAGLDVRGTPREGMLRFSGAEAGRIVAAMATGTRLRVGDETSVMGMVSLKGSSAALRFVDAEQGRAGTVTAAVAKGGRPATTVPPAAPLPAVRFVRPGGTPAPFPAKLRAAVDKESECGSVYEGGTGDLPPVERHALGDGKTLVLLPCGSGAYNFSTRPYLLGAGAKPVVAAFDGEPGMAPEGPPDLVNARFDAATGRLETYAKGRGIGDCGSSAAYVWNGTRFRLVEQHVMPECRGSVNWLTVWRAQAVGR
ncbi:hypothetical protein COC42_08720 [Sphingomonas spermidinifaciens]|uniref:DUF1176 domain-containing protein n=1 Tax=Sphingomonas spermidinifaciens TaxID=1141889 RepID=A0A2A4B8E1_9SPHN|nr:DUF1176 domain-containing protein [Sphingomonas spermidinifaciens]PCD04340.1 hypothetical protein COC42_08720 [Sphingomonas spermidinifaciens]